MISGVRGKLVTWSLLLLVSLPTLLVVVSSFGNGDKLEFPFAGWSLIGYGDFFSDDAIRQAFVRSLLVGAYAVAIALPIGLAAALALFRYRVRFSPAITAFLLLGFSTPLVVSGMALLILYYQIGQIGNLFMLALAIVTTTFPLMLLAIGSSIDLLNPELEEAASTMGAERLQTFIFVTLPGVLPGVLLGSLLVFVTAITEFLVSLILTTSSNQTLPVVLFSSLRSSLKLRDAAAGGIYIGIAVILVLLMTQLKVLDQFFRRKE
jgi:putative spermidine/putrescine transport system permease protein